MKAEVSQSTQLWTRQVHDFKKSQAFFTECLKEQVTH